MPFDDYPDDNGFHYGVAFVYSILVALIWIPAAIARSCARAVREFGTENWPRANGTITSGNVKVIHGWLADYALGRLEYCYKTHGEYYSGNSVWQFADEQSAWDFVDSRRDKSVIIRYRDGRPDVSVLRRSDQLALSELKQEPGVGTQLWQHWKDEMRGDPESNPAPTPNDFDDDLDGDQESDFKDLSQGSKK